MTNENSSGPFSNEHRAATQVILGMMKDSGAPTVVQISGIEGGEGTSTVAKSLARSVRHASGLAVQHLRIPNIAEGGNAGPANDNKTTGSSVKTLPYGILRKIMTQGVQKSLGDVPPEVRFILLETPPVLTSVEAVAVSREVDGVLLVLEGDRSTFSATQKAQQAIEHSSGNLLGVILNKRQYRILPFIARLFNFPVGSTRKQFRTFYIIVFFVIALLLLLAVLGSQSSAWLAPELETDTNEIQQ